MKKLFLFLTLLSALLAHAQSTGDPWKPFQFLIGDWVGSGSGQPGQGTGGFSLKPDLDNKILIRHNANHISGATHQDLLIIYSEKGSYRAEYFDNEGHVIHYKITSSENQLQFLSDTPPTGTRFKLTYEKQPDDTVAITFAIAPPNQDFHPYLNGTVKRK